MKAQELRQFTADELKNRVRQWREELFHARFKAETTENKNTSVFQKLRGDIARGLTVLNEKVKAGNVEKPADKGSSKE